MKDYDSVSAKELIEESGNLIKFQGEQLHKLAENLNKDAEYKTYILSIIEQCSDWLTFMVDYTPLTTKENVEFDDLISQINMILGR